MPDILRTVYLSVLNSEDTILEVNIPFYILCLLSVYRVLEILCKGTIHWPLWGNRLLPSEWRGNKAGEPCSSGARPLPDGTNQVEGRLSPRFATWFTFIEPRRHSSDATEALVAGLTHLFGGTLQDRDNLSMRCVKYWTRRCHQLSAAPTGYPRVVSTDQLSKFARPAGPTSKVHP